MKAIAQNRYGSPDVLRLVEAPVPTPGPHDVLVRVQAASVNARDWHMMRGDPYVVRLMSPEFRMRGPRDSIRGTDFAGTVEAVGADVSALRPGDEVYGEAIGAFAEYVKAPDTAVALKPRNLSFAEAAAVPLAANTALMGLRDAVSLTGGQHLAINGASGGVGTFAIQLAKAFSAQVTAVCSTRNADLVRSLGADHVVDYTREDFTRHRYDVVLDLVGNRTLKALRRALTADGTLILSGGGVSRGGSLFGPMGLIVRGTLASRFGQQRIVVLEAAPSAANLATLTEMIEAGQLAPVVDRTYPLSQTAEAVRYVEVEHARAKVVLTL